jgi:hypothetical protein
VNGPRVLVTTDLDLLTDLDSAVAASAMASLDDGSSRSRDGDDGQGGDNDVGFAALVAAAVAEGQRLDGPRSGEAAARAAQALSAAPRRLLPRGSDGGSLRDGSAASPSSPSSSVFGATCPWPVLACVHVDPPPDCGTYLRRVSRLFGPGLSGGPADGPSSSRRQTSLEAWAPLSVCLADPNLDARLLPYLAALVADAGQLGDNPLRLSSFLVDVGGSPRRGDGSSGSPRSGGGSSVAASASGFAARSDLSGAGFAMGVATGLAAAFGAGGTSTSTSSDGDSSSSSRNSHLGSSHTSNVSPWSLFAARVGLALAGHFPETTADDVDDVFKEPAPHNNGEGATTR